MKQVLFYILCLGTVALTSCEKEYTCVCSEGWIKSNTYEVTVKAHSSKDAEDECRKKVNVGTAIATNKACSLK